LSIPLAAAEIAHGAPSMMKFYGHFAAAYGTIWFVMMLYAFLTHSHVNAGSFGLFGFPIIAFFYALIRVGMPTQEAYEIARLQTRIAQLEARIDGDDTPPPPEQYS
jgi:hypothetical protein